MRSADLPEVRSLHLFQTMKEETFDSIVKAAYFQTFPDHVVLIEEGEPADFLYVVIEGRVELFAHANGRETSLAMVSPIGTFILAAVLKDAPYLMSARTCQRSRILMIPAEDLRAAVDQDKAFAAAIIRELASCYRAVVKDHKSLKLRTGVERLANRLLRYHHDQGGNGSLSLPYDKRTLASLLGMTPENLSRAFNTLKPYGVTVDGGTVRLHDLVALETLAKPNSLIDDRRI
ncbi:cyclic nucleotide-binding domain-containing protein [Sneathiella chungangensis]|uniref:Cyclic nucleotide-binding domain-containing protein n=1 Tax=Sneathiella chungangensis TaxID=1418234 RepID=A0A845M7W0_9PROT|nr:cyclic nucleotide-binding domain-containing protein [Sneathiella chungangensis]MZR20898.1 cyclic nucleotide-binding domain-containing protein [Sneathiella chungangensis]